MNSDRKPRVVLIIQARMGSTRLPGKLLKKVLGRPLIAFLTERLRRVKNVDAIVMATTINPMDAQLIEFCQSEKLSYFRGSEENVLDRYYQCAKEYQADVIVRVTADCPLIDPAVIDEVIQQFLKKYSQMDLASNVIERTYPRGMDVEVFSFKSLETVINKAQRPEEKEHVTPYYYRHPETFKMDSIVSKINNSHHRWTVDTSDDLTLISLVLEVIYPKNPSFTLEELLNLFSEHPDWVEINAHVKQKEIG